MSESILNSASRLSMPTVFFVLYSAHSRTAGSLIVPISSMFKEK